MKVAFSVLKWFFVYFVTGIGCFLMLRLIFSYTTFETDINFLKEKQEWVPVEWWRLAFYIHVFTAVIALLAGLTQFSNYLLTRYRKLHRVVGKSYVICILVVNFPAGMVLALTAKGLLPSQIAFVILDCCWFYFTLRAFLEVRKGNIESHKRFMIRSYALTFSAVTLRAWKLVLIPVFHPDPLTLYMIQAWIGFVPNMLFAEWLIRRRQQAYLSSLPLHITGNQINDKA